MLGMVVGCGNNKVEQQEISKNQIEETIVGEDNSKLINELDIAEFWELYSEKDGTKIWKATQLVRYSPVIVFNEGEMYATPIMPGMNSSGQYLAGDGTSFDVASELQRDLQFCCLLDLTKVGVGTDVENNPINGTAITTVPVFSGNTYVQYAKKPILQKNWSEETFYPTDEGNTW